MDAARIDGWLERFAGYRVHVSRQRIQQWLDQFHNDHRDLGARILDAVEFYREDQLTHAYRAVFGRLPGWSKMASERQGRWRFVAFSTRVGESGDRMLHTFRTATGLSAARFDDLFIHRSDLLRENLTADDTVVFVDDFAGTGNQAVTAWNESLGELLPGRPRIFLVLVVAIHEALTQIGSQTPIKVRAFRHLRAHDISSRMNALTLTARKRRGCWTTVTLSMQRIRADMVRAAFCWCWPTEQFPPDSAFEQAGISRALPALRAVRAVDLRAA